MHPLPHWLTNSSAPFILLYFTQILKFWSQTEGNQGSADSSSWVSIPKIPLPKIKQYFSLCILVWSFILIPLYLVGRITKRRWKKLKEPNFSFSTARRVHISLGARQRANALSWCFIMECPCSTLDVLGCREGWHRCGKQLSPTAPRAAGPQECCSHVPPTQVIPGSAFESFHQSFLRVLVALVLLNLFKTCWKVGNWHLSASYYLCCIPRLWCTDFPRAAARHCWYSGCGTGALGAHVVHFLEPDTDHCEEYFRKQVWLPQI